jgi:hypothetical protein
MTLFLDLFEGQDVDLALKATFLAFAPLFYLDINIANID